MPTEDFLKESMDEYVNACIDLAAHMRGDPGRVELQDGCHDAWTAYLRALDDHIQVKIREYLAETAGPI